jgi:hypothetical protein
MIIGLSTQYGTLPPLGGSSMSQMEIERPDREFEPAQADLRTAGVAEAGKRLDANETAHHGPSLTTRQRRFRPNYSYWAASAQEVRIAEQKRSRELYGDAFEEVVFLRRCGWVINLWHDGRVQFGNQILTFGELREKAARERRLRQPTPIGATGVQV